MGFFSGIQRYVRNPSFGLLPLLLFCFIQLANDARIAVIVALCLSICGSFIVKKYSRLIYEISVISFSIVLLFAYFITPSLDNFSIFILVEIVFVLSLTCMRLARVKILLRLARSDAPYVKNYLAESFRVAFQTQYGLSIHLLLILSFFIFDEEWIYKFNLFPIKWMAIVILLLILLFETIRLRILNKKLFKEEWLPVVTEKGDVMGRVAKSVTKDMKNKFMHPVVRVALVYNGKIYLRKRESSRLLNPGLLDYPFEKYMQYDHDIDEAVHNAVKKECGTDDIPLRFLLKYIFENDTTKRLIFLYVAVIENEKQFNELHLEGGKLWTDTQINDNMGTNIFSECFELEFEYLKNTVLLVHQLQLKI